MLKEVNILPVHESLDQLVKPGEEESWTSFDDSQSGVKEDLQRWGQQLKVTLEGPWACLALWGDAAPYTSRDSILLLTLQCAEWQASEESVGGSTEQGGLVQMWLLWPLHHGHLVDYSGMIDEGIADRQVAQP